MNSKKITIKVSLSMKDAIKYLQRRIKDGRGEEVVELSTSETFWEIQPHDSRSRIYTV